jgi:hypothetical protein
VTLATRRGDTYGIRRRLRVLLREEIVNLSVADTAAVVRESADSRHPPMHTQLVVFHLFLMTTGAVGRVPNFRVVLGVGSHVAVETLCEAVDGFSERIDIGVVTVEAHRRIGACGWCRRYEKGRAHTKGGDHHESENPGSHDEPPPSSVSEVSRNSPHP